MLGGYLGDMNNFLLAFIITGIMSLVAAGIISTVRIPTKKQEEKVSIKAKASNTLSTATVD
jgi:hypothetical protein